MKDLHEATPAPPDLDQIPLLADLEPRQPALTRIQIQHRQPAAPATAPSTSRRVGDSPVGRLAIDWMQVVELRRRASEEITAEGEHEPSPTADH